MGEHSYTAVGNPNDTTFVDPTGNYAAQQGNLNNFVSQFNSGLGQFQDPNAAFNAFMGQSGALANMAQGATAPLTQSLNAVAAREAALGGEAALSAMPGSANSGAGMAAFGGAYADPFARAQAQIQSQQLGLTGQLWNNALGQNYGAYNQRFGNYADLLNGALGQQTAMAQAQGSMWSPTYTQEKNFWDYALPVVAAGLGGSAAFAGAAAPGGSGGSTSGSGSSHAAG